MEFIRALMVFSGLVIIYHRVTSSNWSEWWSYDGISGPQFWGLINPEWQLCVKGKYQSPINIDPVSILYDPNLPKLKLVKSRVSGTLINSGRDVRLWFFKDSYHSFLITGGPLIYTFTVSYLSLHFGETNNIGSEHSIDNQSFPLEIQLVAYNSDIFSDFKSALTSSFGIAAISIFGKLAKKTDKELKKIINNLMYIRFKGNTQKVHDLFTEEFLPDITHYITYDGSMSSPGCEEVVRRIVLNKPIYLSENDLKTIRQIYKSDEQEGNFPLKNTFRHRMPLNNRTIRTNIPLSYTKNQCQKIMQINYKASSRHKL